MHANTKQGNLWNQDLTMFARLKTLNSLENANNRLSTVYAKLT